MGHGPSSNPPTTMAVCFRTHSRHNGPGVNTRNPDIMALCNHSGSPDLKERRTKMTTNFTQMWMDVYFNQRWKWNGHFAVYFFKIHQNAKRNESFNESGCIDWELFVFITQTLLTMKQWQLSSFLNDFMAVKLIENTMVQSTKIIIWKNMWMTVNTKLNHKMRVQLLQRKCHHFDKMFIIGCTGSCQNDNFRCSQWWKFHRNDNFSF